MTHPNTIINAQHGHLFHILYHITERNTNMKTILLFRSVLNIMTCKLLHDYMCTFRSKSHV